MGEELCSLKTEVFYMYSSDGTYIPLGEGEIKEAAIVDGDDTEVPLIIARLGDHIATFTLDLNLRSNRRTARRLYKMLGLSYVESIFPKKKKRKRNRLYRRRMRLWS